MRRYLSMETSMLDFFDTTSIVCKKHKRQPCPFCCILFSARPITILHCILETAKATSSRTLSSSPFYTRRRIPILRAATWTTSSGSATPARMLSPTLSYSSSCRTLAGNSALCLREIQRLARGKNIIRTAVLPKACWVGSHAKQLDMHEIIMMILSAHACFSRWV